MRTVHFHKRIVGFGPCPEYLKASRSSDSSLLFLRRIPSRPFGPQLSALNSFDFSFWLNSKRLHRHFDHFVETLKQRPLQQHKCTPCQMEFAERRQVGTDIQLATSVIVILKQF